MKTALFSIVAIFFSIPAYAASISYVWEAEFLSATTDDSVSSIVDDVSTSPGATLSGTLTLDDTLVSEFATVRTFGPASATVTGLDLTGVIQPDKTKITDFSTSDQIAVLSDLPVANGQQVERIAFFFRDNSNTVFSIPGLPSLLPVDQFSFPQVALITNIVGQSSASERVTYEITSLRLASDTPPPDGVVPLPAGLPLLLGGLGVLGLFRRRSN